MVEIQTGDSVCNRKLFHPSHLDSGADDVNVGFFQLFGSIKRFFDFSIEGDNGLSIALSDDVTEKCVAFAHADQTYAIVRDLAPSLKYYHVAVVIPRCQLAAVDPKSEKFMTAGNPAGRNEFHRPFFDFSAVDGIVTGIDSDHMSRFSRFFG